MRGYCKDLKRKRFARAYRRYRKTRAKKLSLGAEALDLLEQEIIDKQLNRTYYYEASEPSEYVINEIRLRVLTNNSFHAFVS